MDVQSVDFLYTTTYKRRGFHNTHKLDIRVFFKNTNTHLLLFRTSYHPKHTYTAIVKAQLLRFHRICTRQEDFLTAVRLLLGTLTTRRYSCSFLRRCLKTFSQRRTVEISPIVPIITTYSNSTRALIRKVRQFQSEY